MTRRPIKRLLTPYDPQRWASDLEWAAEIARWKSYRISPEVVLRLLRQSVSHRRMYEDYLGLAPAIRSDQRQVLAQHRTIQGLLEQLAKYALFFEEHKGFFGNLGKEVERVLERYRASPAALRQRSPVSTAPMHRPGEPWAKPFILKLAKIFRQHDFSRNKTTKAITSALSLAGHADVIKDDQIRHLLWRKKTK